MKEEIPFVEFPKLARLSREVIVSEKIDGSNASILITDEGEMLTGSRTKWITPQSDNFGFAGWCQRNKDELMKLGPGHHFGEWWGNGIQRNYGLKEKRFSLFNVARWGEESSRPSCCGVVPLLYQGMFDTAKVDEVLQALRESGSHAVPGWMTPEGIVVFHVAANMGFKKTCVKDEKHKFEL